MSYQKVHPGVILKEMVFDSLEISVTDAAKRLGMSRGALSRVLNGHTGISVDLAFRLELAGISTARMWLNLQSNYDLWLVQQHEWPRVDRIQEPQVVTA